MTQSETVTLPRPDAAPLAPRLRGRLHQLSALVSIPAGIVVIAAAQGVEARIGAAVFALSLTALYATSAAYHRGAWSPRARTVMRRLDHAMIFVLIAGTYTPITLLALRPAWGVPVLAAVWIGALTGVTVVVTALHRFPRLPFVLYLTLSWLAILASPEIVRTLRPVELVLLAAGGVSYTVGAVLLVRNRPRLWPATFGYHEVWHAFVVVGGVCHYVLILILVRG